MSTCSGDADTVDTGSNVSVVSSNVSAGPMIALIVILDDEPKPLTAELENVISVELKWRGIKVSSRTSVEPGCEGKIYEERVEEFFESVAKCEKENPPCISVLFVRVDAANAENFRNVVRGVNERQGGAKFWVCVISTVGTLVINDEIKTEVLDFSNNGIWVAKYLARELIVAYTRHLGIHNGRRQMRGPPIVIFVRETPTVGQKPLSSRLAEALLLEPISFIHHRVGYLISQPDTISDLSELAVKNGYSSEDITNGCRIYLRTALDYDLDSSTVDVIIIDTLNDIYLDVDGMMKIAHEKASSVFVMEDASEETVDRILDTMVWMIKRRCHYTDGPYADYFYTQMSLHKEMDTLRIFVSDSIGDCSTEVGPEEDDHRTPLTTHEERDQQRSTSETNIKNRTGSDMGKVQEENALVDGGAGDHGNDTQPALEAVPSKG